MSSPIPAGTRMWAGFQQWGCRHCAFVTIDGQEALDEHERLVHNKGLSVPDALKLERKQRKGVSGAANNADQN